jgi:hypothetical protein
MFCTHICDDSAYFLFSEEVRNGIIADMRAKHGKVNTGEVARITSRMWNNETSEEQKAKYYAQVKEAQEKYLEAKQAFESTDTFKELSAKSLEKKQTLKAAIATKTQEEKRKTQEEKRVAKCIEKGLDPADHLKLQKQKEKHKMKWLADCEKKGLNPKDKANRMPQFRVKKVADPGKTWKGQYW